VSNVGISQQQIPIVYLIGGAATFITARFIGHWADKLGKVRIYRWIASLAMLPLLTVTHIGVVPLWAWVICTTSFFVFVSGRMIPAMAIISSAAQPALRGTFMSLNGTVQSLSMGLATSLAGFVIVLDESGKVSGYSLVGYIAMSANMLAILFASTIELHDRPSLAVKAC
jgi:predicted MFS family arabinose efflux permease